MALRLRRRIESEHCRSYQTRPPNCRRETCLFLTYGRNRRHQLLCFGSRDVRTRRTFRRLNIHRANEEK